MTYSGQNAQNSAVRAAAAGVSNRRVSRHAKSGIAAGERTPQHGPGPQSRPFRSEERHGGGQQHVRPWRQEGVEPLQAGARGEPLGPLDVPAHVRVDVIDGRVDHQPPHDPDHGAGHDGGQGDPVPPVHRHNTESRQCSALPDTPMARKELTNCNSCKALP